MAVKIRHTNRYREIATALVRHGFGYMVEEMDLFHLLSLPRKWILRKDPEEAVKTLEVRVRLLLEDLGPAFIKLGQLLSTRTDLLSDAMILELEKLQDQVPPFPTEEARRIVEEALHQPIGELLDEFGEVPLAAASIGQVHFGRLKTGEPVAIKIQRPLVDKTIKRDLEILKDFAALAERKVEWAARYQIVDIVEEFSKSMIAELNFTYEGENTEKIAAPFRRSAEIRIPAIYWDYCSPKVLTMEFVEGIKLTERETLLAKGHDLKTVAERLVNAMLKQIFSEGFFHADPHPGNLFVMADGKVAFVDFGMVGRLSEEMKYHLSSLIIALMRHNTDGIIRAILRLGLVPDEVDRSRLRRDLDLLREKYYDLPMAKVSLGKAVSDLFAVAQHHRIYIPSDLTLLGKALITIEGVMEKIHPDISILDMAEPFGRKLIMERLRPDNVQKRLWKNVSEFAETVADVPRQANHLSKLLRTGKLRMEIGLSEIDLILRKLDQISNRISFSIVLLSFSIIAVGLMLASSLGQKPTFLWNIPVLEVGSGVASLMLVWLLYSIFKSGRF